MGSRVQALSCILWTSLLFLFTDASKVNAGLSSGNATGTDEDARHHKRNNRVLIGLLSQPSDPSGRHESYIAASYVKFLESAGARVVPFVHDMDKDEIKRRFDMVNGFLLPGGSARLRPGHTFFDAATEVVRLANEANDKGDYFPILAICLGFETLAIIASGNVTILGSYDSEDTAAPLYFTEKAKNSRFFGSLPEKIVADLAAKPYARESHSHGLSLASFDANKVLKEEYEVLSLSTDPEGEVYISTMESKKYPYTATQWHPEKNAYEWGDKLHIPHSKGAIDVTYAVASFFVDQARGNFHAPRSILEEDDALIYGARLEFTGRHTSEDDAPWMDEGYFFDDWSRRKDAVIGSAAQ
ncbi:g3269 [Coccomyxa elongata]